jgi:hypothetical protein
VRREQNMFVSAGLPGRVTSESVCDCPCDESRSGIASLSMKNTWTCWISFESRLICWI